MGVPEDATFGRLSIGGAKRRVRTFARLGDVADLEARRLCIYDKRADVFSAGAEVFLPVAGGRGDFPVLGGQLVWIGSSRWVFPRLYALSMDPGVSVQRAWHRAWALALPEALSDQRVAEAAGAPCRPELVGGNTGRVGVERPKLHRPGCL